MMNLEQLETFLVIARYQSVNRAADTLFLAQSTVTHRLRQLENEVGLQLFVRAASGVTLTREGQRLLPTATSIVEQMRLFLQSAAPAPLTIVAGRAFAGYELPRLLGQYRREHPAFTCYLRSTLYDESIQSLLSGTADIAFLGSEAYHPELRQRALPADEVVLIAPPTHPFARSFPGLFALHEVPMIAFGTKASPFRRRVDDFLAQREVFPDVIMELDSISAVRRMVAQGLGVGLLPKRTVADDVQHGRLCAVAIENGAFTRPSLIVYPKHKEADENFHRFLDWVVRNY